MIGRKGLSTVVTTVIMVLLVLVAVSVVWVVINNILGETSEQININSKCVATILTVDSVDCTTPSACSVVIKKGGGGPIHGIIAVFSDATSSGIPVDKSGDIQITSTFVMASGLTAPNSISVAAYFTDDTGTNITCTQIADLNF